MLSFWRLTTLALALFPVSMAAAQIPEEFQSKACTALFSQISVHPETDAQLAWMKGDRRFYELVRFAPDVPFENNHPTHNGAFTDKLKAANGVKRLDGINDYGSSPKCLGFEKSAENYAPRYNSTVLEISLNKPLQNALAKYAKRKSRP
jgi:hypothetical protein